MKRLLAILICCLAATATADDHTWTDSSGKHHTHGELVDFQGGTVYLKKDDGKIIAVPHSKLSAADKQFVDSATPPFQAIRGQVVGITDGDTLTVLSGTGTTKIRLASIDAPESHQAYGTKSREALASKVFQKKVVIEWRELDKYKRTIGQVFLDGRWINKEMIRDGWAWQYRQYSKSEVLAEAESEARTEKIGLWAESNPTAPWEFRHPSRRAPLAAAPKPLAEEKPNSTPLTEADGPQRYVSRKPVPIAQPLASPPVTALSPPVSPPVAAQPPPEESPFADPPKTESPPTAVDRNPFDETATGETATGIPTYTGPRGGQYHYSKSGKKVYEKRRR